MQRSECAILAGMAQATLPQSKTPWQDYADNYDRIRDTMARVLEGFEDFNAAPVTRTASASRSRRGSASSTTASGRAEFSVGTPARRSTRARAACC